MEKLKSGVCAKIVAVILIIVCLVLFIGSLAGMLVMDSISGYQLNKSEMLQKGFDEICENYSVIAMAGYQDDFNEEELSKTNFRYGVVKADSMDDADFQDPDSYIAGNFDEIPDIDSLHFEEYDVGDSTEFYAGNGSILDSYYTINHNSEYEIDVESPVDGFFYDSTLNTFYVRSGNRLFPLTDGVIYQSSDSTSPLCDAEAFLRNTGSEYYFRECESVLFDRGTEVKVSEIMIRDSEELKDFTVDTDAVLQYFNDETVYVTEKHVVKTRHYIVASYAKTPLSGEQNFRSGDMFIQMKLLVDFAYRMRYAVIIILVISLILFIGSFAFLMASAGHRKGKDGISICLLDKLPLDLYFACVFAAEFIILCIIIWCGQEAFGWSRTNNLTGLVSFIVITACAGIAGILIFLAYCMSFSVRVKLGKWWRHTIIYWFWKKCLHLLSGTVHVCIYIMAGFVKSVTLLWKAWLLMGFLAFVEFVAIMSSYAADSGLVFFWIMEKIIIYTFLIIQLLQLNKLQKGAQRIANGALDYQIDTSHMFWEIKKHGEYLNDIGNGINCAVNERMKSEHFKTELITNVSHDIKTPLTSIINYVDLLQKEEISNPAAQEYLEVLHRQSARLKKLIEDLMEASKASTGSLSVVMEKCEAGVMLVQTVGEFEEKLMENQIELQIKKPETEIFIQADNRHLWRVFENLMNNICKYAQPLTRAYVNLEQQGQQAVITFRNISKYQLNISSEELMERFVRGDSSRNTEGSGLGISIAKSLTELMDGTFTLTIDGDLFKAVLTFPLYGTMTSDNMQSAEKMYKNQKFKNPEVKREPGVLDSLAEEIHNAGARAVGLGQNMADKTGRMFRKAGRFAYHVKQAAEQVKAEEAEWETVQKAGRMQAHDAANAADGMQRKGADEKDT